MNNRLQVALAQQSDAPAIWNILQAEIEVMRHAGRNQWQNGYPNPQTVASDIEKGQGRVLWLGTEHTLHDAGIDFAIEFSHHF